MTSQELLLRMNEGRLRGQVLIPLFKAMGFRDVYHYHGGPLEQGKDIVMWKPGEIRPRVNYGVVAKASRITGKARGRSSAAEVMMQIKQCFSKPYFDPVTSEEQKVHRCFVVTSKEVTKEALNSLESILRASNLDKVTEFIDGEKLSSLVEEHLVEMTVREKLNQVRRVLDEVSPDYRLVASTGAKGVHYRVEPKYPGADMEHPLSMHARFVFPDTPEAQAVREAYERHVRTGTSVTIPRPYIEEFQLPEFLIPILDPHGEGVSKLEIRSVPSSRPLLARVEVESEQGESVKLEYVHLVAVETGTELITFSNEQQPVPWKFRLMYYMPEKRIELNYVLKLEGVNVKTVQRAVQFQKAMASGGEFRMEHLDTGFELQRFHFPPGITAAPEPIWLEFLNDLVFIQEKTHIPLQFPHGEFTDADFKSVRQIGQILKAGILTFRAERLTVGGKIEFATRVLETFEDGRAHAVSLPADHEVEIFGAIVPLGPYVLSCEKVRMTAENVNALRADILASGPGDEVTVQLTPCEEYLFTAEYPKWLPDK